MNKVIEYDYFGNDSCYFCKRKPVALHEIYFAHNRKMSIKNNFRVFLCPYHHQNSKEGVHFNRERDLILKRHCQSLYEENHSRVEFMALVGRNYL